MEIGSSPPCVSVTWRLVLLLKTRIHHTHTHTQSVNYSMKWKDCVLKWFPDWLKQLAFDSLQAQTNPICLSLWHKNLKKSFILTISLRHKHGQIVPKRAFYLGTFGKKIRRWRESKSKTPTLLCAQTDHGQDSNITLHTDRPWSGLATLNPVNHHYIPYDYHSTWKQNNILQALQHYCPYNASDTDKKKASRNFWNK